RRMLDVYADFAINDAAIPVIRGEKSEKERFAGAQMTLTIEAMMGDGKALQSGTSHYMGQNFARAFDIKFLDPNNEQQHCFTTSWGLSTRFVGAMIMTHGDDKGLVLPPKLAPIQVVIVPIYKGDAERPAVVEAAAAIKQELAAHNLRVKLDDRDNLTPGFKFNEWELKGVPVRIEIGPRDLQNGTVMVGRRDIPGREGKQIMPRAGLAQRIAELLAEIQANLLEKATRFRDEHTTDVTSYDQLKDAIDTGFARGWWAGDRVDEERIQTETKATVRCIPLEQPGDSGTCFYTGKPATKVAIFGRSY
ncbi:MAG: proline--tRNA ligase, partial [Caldilineaceae bacterium]|nr:proline--tRNA ligase [Caldilineaceae bacterium]